MLEPGVPARSSAQRPVRAAWLDSRQRLINMQNAINRMYERQSMIDHGWVPPIEPYDLADLGTALMEEEHAGH